MQAHHDQAWLDAPDLSAARLRLVASQASWVGGVGAAVYAVYGALDAFDGSLVPLATDIMMFSILAATFLVARSGRASALVVACFVVASVASAFVSTAFLGMYDPALLTGLSFLIVLAATGFIILSWRTFSALVGVGVGAWAGVTWNLGLPLLPGFVSVILPGFALGVIAHGFRMKTYGRLYEEHQTRLAHEVTLRRQDRLSSLGALVAGVAHEINNPLTYINGNLELTQMDIDDVLGRPGVSAEHRTALVEMRARNVQALAGLEQIGRIAKGLRMVARENNAAPRRPVAIDDLIEQVLAVIRSRIAPGVTLERQLASGSYASADPGGLSQVLINLILNASQAMEIQGGGTLSVRTSSHGGHVLIEVSDTGPGISPEIEPRLFSPFVTTKASGTGLGLSISQSIVAEHEGEIGYETAPTKGTTFWVRLPCVPAPERAQAGAEPAAPNRI